MTHETLEFTDTHGESDGPLVLKWVEETPFSAAHWHFNGYDGHMHFADQPIANIVHHLRLDGYTLADLPGPEGKLPSGVRSEPPSA